MRKPSYIPGSLVATLLGDLSPHFLELPGAESILRAEMIPAEGPQPADPWHGFSASSAKILDWAAGRGKLPALAEEVGRAVRARPEWIGGRIILAMIDIRRGRADRAREAITPIVDLGDPSMTMEIRKAIIRPLAEVPELVDLATSLAEAGVALEAREKPASSTSFSFSFGEEDDSITRALLDLYRKAGRTAEARTLAMKTFRARLPRADDREFRALMKLDTDAGKLARYLLKIDDPLDALRIAIKARERLGRDYRSTEFPGMLEAALKAVKAAPVEEVLDGLVREDAGDGPAVDLMLLVHPDRLDQAGLTSTLDDAIRAAAAASPSGRAAPLDRLGRLRARDPKGLEVALAEALAALAGPGDRTSALDRLARLVDDRPLEAIAEGGRMTPRQRAEAEAQVPLWLVARACLRAAETRPIGVRLGERALAASRRQLDPSAALAILAEWGRIEGEGGDPAAARARWGEMISLLDDRARLKPTTGPAPVVGPAAAAPLLPEHCHQVLEVAALAARRGDFELSLSAALEALRNGPPALAAAQARFTYSRGNTDDVEVANRLVELDGLWREHGAPADPVYRTLLAIVLPDSRPEEVFPYTVDLAGVEYQQTGLPFRPKSAALILGEWAARAGRLDELVRAVEARKPRALAELPARIVLTEVGQVRGEARLTLEQLEWFDRRLDKDAGTYAVTLAAHVGLAALDRPETRDRARSLLAHTLRAAEGLTTKPTWMTPVRGQVALADLARGDLPAALASLEAAVQVEPLGFSAGPNYLDQLRRSSLKTAVTQCVVSGRPEPAWEMLGRVVDLDRVVGSPYAMGFELEWLLDNLAARPAPERFDFLKGWIIPADPKKPLRLAFVGGPVDDSATPPDGGWRSPGRALLDTFSVLVEAARQSNRLDELAALIEHQARANREHAEGLALIVAIARGQASAIAPRVAGCSARVAERLKTTPAPGEGNPTTEAWLDGRLALACLETPELRGIGMGIADRLSSAPDDRGPPTPMRRRLRAASNSWRLAGPSPVDRPPVDLALRYWRAEGPAPAGPSPEGWVGAEGHLAMIPGSPPRPLRLAFGLKGPFEFRCEASAAGLVEFGGRSFARVSSSVAGPGPTSGFPPAGGAARPPAGSTDPVAFHGYRLAVGEDGLRCWIDGRLVYESDDPGRSFPWLTLAPDPRSDGPVVFRNLSLSGRPEILRQVDLSEGRELRWAGTAAEPLGRAGARNPLASAANSYYQDYLLSQARTVPPGP